MMSPIPLEQLHFATFQALVKTRFVVVTGPERTIELQLIEAECVGSSGKDDPGRPRSESFSLVFSGAAAAQLPQRTYRFRHEQIGEFDLFIVPIAAEQGTVRYQAIFNRSLTPQ